MKQQIAIPPMMLQYVSVILIVLAVVLGALTSPAPLAHLNTPPQMQVELGSLKIENIFPIQSDAIVASDLLEGLVTALLSHDVRAVIEVGVEPREASPHIPSPAAVARSVALYRYLIGRKVPVDAVRVFAVPYSTVDGIQVVLKADDPTQGDV